MGNLANTVLLIDDDPLIAANIKVAFNHETHAPRHLPARFQLVWKKDLGSGLDYLKALPKTSPTTITSITAIIFGATDKQGSPTDLCNRLRSMAPDTPFLGLVNPDTPPFDQQALHKNLRGRLSRQLLAGGNTHELFHVLHRAIERMAMERSLNRIEAVLQTERQRFMAALSSVSDGILSIDGAGKITHMNLIAENLTGWALQEAEGKPLDEVFRVIDGVTRQTLPFPLEEVAHGNKIRHFDTHSILLTRMGEEIGIEDIVTPIRDSHGRLCAAVLAFRQMGEEAQSLESLRMTHMAQHDALTGLPNRTLMQDRLAHAITLSHRRRRKAAFLYMDMDHFKNINDTLGHPIGDKLLQTVAERLKSCVRQSDTVCRLGGDEFVVLLSEIEQSQDAALCAEKMLKVLSAPILIEDHQLYISMSIGISICPDDGDHAETLIKNADTAMYHAKSGGRAGFQFFKQSMNDHLAQRKVLANRLRKALEQQQFVLHYQPRINLQSGAITGVEALVRWYDPEQGLVSPAAFVSVAEECGLMLEIGRWVLHEACRQTQDWRQAGIDVPSISVNVSLPEFRNRDFVGNIRGILEETGLPPSHLEIELTENALMKDLENARTQLADLREMGIRIAIDDFGTGHSSLTQLKHFPVDTLKIDGSFIQCVTNNPVDAAIISAVIDMGKKLNYRIVAEGVETLEQQRILQTYCCDETQGHHFSRPLPAVELAKLMQNHRSCLH